MVIVNMDTLLNDALEAIKEYIEWGAMTGSDRDLFSNKFKKILNEAGIKYTEPEY